MKNFIVRAISGLIYAAIMIVGISFRPEAMILLFTLITGLTAWEFTGLVNRMPDVNVNRFITTAAAVYFFFAMSGFCAGITQSEIFIPYLLTIIYLMVSGLYTRNKNALHDWAYTMMCQMYVALPFSTVCALAFHTTPDGQLNYDYLAVLSVFIFLWGNDTGAYCIGSLLGRHKLFPRVSPGKSWEGSVGGAVVVLLMAAGLYWFDMQMGGSGRLNLLGWMGFGLVVVVFGTWGDLVESLLKRTLGIKDSGNIMPGHGGMLDRFDSSLLAIPASVVYFHLLIHMG